MQELKQELRLRQELALQPQQILRSELIQLPLLELEMRVKAELEENPFLEEIGDSDDSELADECAAIEPSGEDEMESPPADRPLEGAREVDWEDILNDADQWAYRTRTRVQTEDTIDIPQPAVDTLDDHLREQLRFDNLTSEEIAVGEEIIGNINRDGYLEVALEDIAQDLGCPLETVTRVHDRILRYDPIGIGARDLRECLLVQLETRRPPQLVAKRMIEEFWDDFTKKRFESLAEKMGVAIDEVREAFGVIARLNPKPGEGSFDEKQNYVIPDLIITKVADEIVVYLNDGDIPNFQINPAYREMFLDRKGTDKEVREFLTRKFESARWFINAIHQRRTTMLRTARAIVQRQREFFENGPSHLKPMILADIAADIGMDISTISRVTSGKYAQTDWGVFELKYFFSERIETDTGEEVSNRVIKARLRELIESEDKANPYSDQALTEMLNREGFKIRRRTVAKYREQMRIPVKRLRRQL